jgi:hypothetical protein
MKSMTIVAGAIALAGAAGAANAAEPMQIAALTTVDGKVLIHKGKDYTVAKAGSTLIQGDSVITLKGSKADVAFTEGCVTSLKENAVLAIGGVNVCATGPLSKAGEPVKYAQAIGAPVVAGAETVATGGGLLGLSTGMTAALIGGGVIGTVAAVDASQKTNNKNPISGQ